MDKFFTLTSNYPKADVNMIASKFLTVEGLSFDINVLQKFLNRSIYYPRSLQ